MKGETITHFLAALDKLIAEAVRDLEQKDRDELHRLLRAGHSISAVCHAVGPALHVFLMPPNEKNEPIPLFALTGRPAEISKYADFYNA